MTRRVAGRRTRVIQAATLATLSAMAALTPAASAAPQLTTPLACWNWFSPAPQTFPVFGSGLPPHVTILVRVKGDIYTEGEAATDANGNLAARVTSSTMWSSVPTLATIEAREASTQQPQPPPLLLTTMRVPAVRRAGEILYQYSPHRAFRARARLRTTWGGYPGQAVYAHYYYESRLYGRPHLVREVRLGVMTGPCGGLDVSFPILGGLAPRVGGWLLVVDRHRHLRWHSGLLSPTVQFDVNRGDGRAPRPFRGARRGTWYLVGY